MIRSFKDILEAAMQAGPKRIAVPFPTVEDVRILSRAAASGLAVPCLIGRTESLKAAVGRTPLASREHEIVDGGDRKEALRQAVARVRDGRADILMQGGASHRAVMKAVLDPAGGLKKKGSTASYISVFPLLKREKLILITDTFLNDFPGLVQKQGILNNALQLARRLGMETPNVAVLAAIEQVNPGIPSTLDAAILSKMGERRQFGKAVVEGPVDIDCALSKVAADRKGLQSAVTGNVDIYLVPEIDTGHLLAESLVFFGGMQTVGVVAGTAGPVLLKLPFTSAENRVVEIALAGLMSGKGANHG